MSRQHPRAGLRVALLNPAQADNAGALLLPERQHCAPVAAPCVNMSVERLEAEP